MGFFRGAKTCFTVLHFYNGALREKDTMLIDEPLESDEEAISQLLRQYYMQRSAFPKHILLPMEPEDREELEHLFSDAAGERVYLEVPKRGERLGLVTKALVNAKEETLRATSAQQRRTSALKWLQKALDLNDYPTRIEAFDVSNLGDTGIVAAMTVHRDGKPLKRDYRKFKISDLEQRDDYASMHQAVYRRFKRYCDGSSGFTELPQQRCWCFLFYIHLVLLPLLPSSGSWAQNGRSALSSGSARLPGLQHLLQDLSVLQSGCKVDDLYQGWYVKQEV